VPESAIAIASPGTRCLSKGPGTRCLSNGLLHEKAGLEAALVRDVGAAVAEVVALGIAPALAGGVLITAVVGARVLLRRSDRAHNFFISDADILGISTAVAVIHAAGVAPALAGGVLFVALADAGMFLEG
jgi:hypothetical protein